MLEVGKTIRRSKAAVLEALKISLGGYRLREITRSALIDYGKKRAKAGAGPAALATDFSFIGTLLTHAAAVHGITAATEEVRLARVALIRLGLVGNPSERERKYPPKKDGNNQRIPMLNLTGYDAWEVLLEQRIVTRGNGKLFSSSPQVGRNGISTCLQGAQDQRSAFSRLTARGDEPSFRSRPYD